MLQLLEQVQSQLSACQVQLTALQDLAHSHMATPCMACHESEENAELHSASLHPKDDQVHSLKTQLVHA